MYTRSLLIRVSNHCVPNTIITQIVSSVKDSLRCDLVQPHIDALSVSCEGYDSKGNNDMPTLVLVLAVSGGCDSIALFHAVLALAKSREDFVGSNPDNLPFWLHLGMDDAKRKDDGFKVPCELHVAHFNHEQRGEDSDGDEAFVRSLCQENEVALHCYSWSEEDFLLGAPGSESSNITTESDGEYVDGDSNNDIAINTFTQDVARKWRRQKLKDLLSDLVLSPNDAKSTSDELSRLRWGAILTAHHRDDCDETILLKLLRGSHLTNLWGMDARSDGFDLRLVNDSENDGNVAQHDASSQYSFVGYFAKPMLKVRKKHIMEYLRLNSLEWRDDESNSSSKYKRNKVRNELMPLLSEIAGGEHALQKRFSNLESQSRDISRDLSNRSKDYLQAMPSTSSFLLPRDSRSEFDLVTVEALHLWIMKETNRGLQLSYDQMLRIRDQIHNYPDRLQWTLDVGSCWKLRRNGDTLALLQGEENTHVTVDSGITLEDTLPWKIIRHSEAAESIANAHELSVGLLPRSAEHGDIMLQQVKDCGNIKFTPPWRKGRSAIKIKEFLRGQKVPLHCRDEAIVLCLSDNSSSHALAVYLDGTGDDGRGRWVVNADFSPKDDLPATKVVLGKTSHS
ncbi:hypothetical protein ACHAXR_009779 [Thalassiosira sp. AJA248-18]